MCGTRDHRELIRGGVPDADRVRISIWKNSSGGASLIRMPEDNGGSAHTRYRALLDVSAAMGEQPTVKAVLHSLRDVLSSSVRLHGTDLYLLDSGQETLHLLEFDRAANAPAIKIAPTVDLVFGYKKSNESPILKLLLSRLDELVARFSKKAH